MNRNRLIFAVAIAALFISGCSSSKKAVSQLYADKSAVELALARESDFLPDNVSGTKVRQDTIVVKGEDGNDVILMKAIQDDETGEMVATETLEAAVITARFRNLAERNGKVDLEWLVKVPKSMIQDDWQIRLNTDMFIMEDSIRLEPIIITGSEYRKKQLRGYEQYDKFLNTIITDTSVFVNKFLLERFIERNIPELYKFAQDTSFVTDEQFSSVYGVSEREAIDHYTNDRRVNYNQRRKDSRAKVFNKKVKVPIVTEGLRLDTVMVANNGDFIYDYVQTINTRPKLRKVDIYINGDIYEQENHLYTIPKEGPLTFYISSLASFLRETERYTYEIIWRQAEANASYNIQFDVAKDEVKPSIANNAKEIELIKTNLRELLNNTTYDLDSIVVTASSSPEGGISTNANLSRRRSQSVTRYFDNFMQHVVDSLNAQREIFIDEEGNVSQEKAFEKIKFLSRSEAENWDGLDEAFVNDTTFTDEQYASYMELRNSIKDLDALEHRLQREPYYKYLKEKIYPGLRVVNFDFKLHRKGMIKDSVHTTVLDTIYMNGLQALRDRDFDTALRLLGPYNDFNAAVAFLAMDRNLSALQILQKEEKTAEVNYMLAILYSRQGEIQKAVQCYMDACKEDSTYISRGNLDPEISALIKTYGLNKQEDDEFEYSF